MPTIYENIINLLRQHQIAYKEYDHEPILSYEDAEKEKNKFHWEGVESKNIFQFTDYLFSPGVTTKTIQTNIQDLKPIFENMVNCHPVAY